MQESGLTVVSVEIVEEETDVFDIEVETDHSFLVHGAVLHNCSACGGLDGQEWPWGDPHPSPSLHFGCRCMLLPVTKSWEQLAREAHGNSTLAKKLDQIDPGTRASMDGQVSAKTTYEDWLSTRPEALQKQILGPARYRLLESGKLTLADLTDMRGNELTLKELARL